MRAKQQQDSNFVLSRIVMFKISEEELGDDKGQYTAKTVSCFHPHTLIYIWKRSVRGSLYIICFLQVIMVGHIGQRLETCTDPGTAVLCFYLFFDKVGVKISILLLAQVFCEE